MNKKGLFFTFMTVLLLLSVIELNRIIAEQQFASSENSIELSALLMLNNKLDSMMASAIELKEANKTFNERIVPFSYTIDGNTILIEQQLPIREALMSNFFDAINSYEIVAEDANTANAFDGIEVDINVPKNAAWGGTSSGAEFLIMPQCLKYSIADRNEYMTNAGKCTEGFDMNSLLRYDLNLTISGYFPDDFNSVECNFAGLIGCPAAEFTEGSGEPFFQLNFNDENCMLCLVEESMKTIKGHFNPAADNNIIFSCTPPGGGSSCNSQPIIITLGTGIRLAHSSSMVDSSLMITFKNPVRTIEVGDVNIMVRSSMFSASARRAS